MSDEKIDNIETFGNMGKTYQEKVVQAFLQDYIFAEQMADVIQSKYFDLEYLQEVVSTFYDYKQKYKTYPSADILNVIISQKDGIDALISKQCAEYLERTREVPLNGDKGFIEDSSLEFCRKQSLKEGLVKAIDMMESGNYDAIQSVIKDSLNKGATRDLGHEYMEGFASRGTKSIRKPIPTGWNVIDREFNGGWERGILSTFIAPTGAGKSMFLVNCGGAALSQGLNVLYITCEMADYKIGLRFDSYFSGVEINKVPDNQEKVQTSARNSVKGRLFIKEFPTKTATPQTIRAYVQRLQATKDFVPDMILVDYADLLRGSRGYGDKRFELESIYEDLRALAMELNVVIITADQTNRSGLEMDVVTISQIGEAYAKATVCDVIMTVSRNMEDKQTNQGRIFIAKSRLGRDGMVFPFILNPATVKVSVLNVGEDPIAIFLENNEKRKNTVSERFEMIKKNGGLASR